jgi:hypothetical protein
MKRYLKIIGSLILDQFVGIIGGSMMVLPMVTFLGDNMKLGGLIAFLFAFGFYAYVAYNTAFKGGFRDEHRIRKDLNYNGYQYKGLLCGLLAAAPLMLYFFVCLLLRANIFNVYYMVASMYWTWPLLQIFQGADRYLIMGLVFIPMVIIPWIGYIAGYKNFSVFDKILTAYKNYTEK